MGERWPLRISAGAGVRLGTTTTLGGLLDELRTHVADGFTRAWLAHEPWGQDALTHIAIAGREVPGIQLGTSVVATYPRHPASLAQQALTVDAAIGHGRLLLGVGTSHRFVVEDYYGYSFDKPAEHTRGFLGTLVPLLDGHLAPKGDGRRMDMRLDVAGAGSPPVYMAALGPKMLAVAGELTSGTITWLAGPNVIAEHIRPRMDEAAEAVGRPRPEVVCGLPICVTADPVDARARVGEHYAQYKAAPSYRATMDRGGAGGPEDVALVGSEAEVSQALHGLAEAGVDEFLAVIFGTEAERERTRALLASGL